MLVEAARAAAHTKDTYLSAQYHRIAAQRGANRAAVAVAHSILTIVHYLLKRKETYSDLGITYYEERKKEAIVKQSIKKLEALGVVVVFCLFC
ncbi:transposase [Thermoanaerobacter kivui]|uniref:Transposase n=1 Tax=Thermoanaerobacter kivui TaxID=2325 RepID=A0A097AQ56_THEKI|nr:transposase [Thermoanaerobacter kivui]